MTLKPQTLRRYGDPDAEVSDAEDQMPPAARLEDPHPPAPHPEAVDGEVSVGHARTVRRRNMDKVTIAEARLLAAWRQLRDVNTWQHPTLNELAHVLGRAPSTVHMHVRNLIRKGVIVKLHGVSKYGRCYALTPEAAARPHLGTLSRLATRIVKLKPHALDGAPDYVREEYGSIWADARAVVAEIVALARVKTTESVAALKLMDEMEAQRDAVLRDRHAARMDDGERSGPSSPSDAR